MKKIMAILLVVVLLVSGGLLIQCFAVPVETDNQKETTVPALSAQRDIMDENPAAVPASYEGCIFVATDGTDEANTEGTIERPFKTLKCAVEFLTANQDKVNTICVRGGEYQHPETIVLEGLKGTADRPIRICNFEDEKVTFKGTITLTNAWKPSEDNPHIYETHMDQDIWQLFRDGKAMITARFPNATWEKQDGIGYLFNLAESTRHLCQAKDENGKYLASVGHFYDENPPKFENLPGDEMEEGSDALLEPARPGINEVGIGDLGYSLKGANVVLHMGSWLSWANKVTEHEAGSDNFKFNTDFSGSGSAMAREAIKWLGQDGKGSKKWTLKNLEKGQCYYFFEGPMCLDNNEEWYYDKTTGTVSVYSDNGAPTGIFEGKAQSYLIDGQNCAYLTIEGIDFFGTTVRINNSDHITLENCDFLYPAFNKLVLDNYEPPLVTEMVVSGKNETEGNNESTEDRTENDFINTENVIRNCKFEYTDGTVFRLSGKNNVIENNLMHHIDFSTLGTSKDGTANIADSWHTIFSHNTIYTAGNSAGIRTGTADKIIYNDLSDMSLLQHDGSLVNAGERNQNDTHMIHNWVHDAPKSSLRFDSANMGSADTVRYGENGTMAYNVAWRTGQMKIKGENHYIIGNTSIASNAPNGVAVALLDNPDMGGFNVETYAYNNAGVMSGAFKELIPIPSKKSGSNYVTSIEDGMLVDWENKDFRPLSSDLIGKGTVILNAHNKYGVNSYQFFEEGDKIAHIGAYAPDCTEYWIPGFQDEKATVPIPGDGHTRAGQETDIMWLRAYKSEKNRIYFGNSEDNLIQIAEQTNNMVHLKNLEYGKTYYWRVDDLVNNEWNTGDIWSFTCVEKTPTN